MNCSYVLNKKKDKRFAGTQQAVARKEIADAVAAAAAAVLLSLYPSNEDAQRRKTGSLPALPGCMASFHLLLLFPRSLAVKWTNLLKQASIYSKYIYTVYIIYIYGNWVENRVSWTESGREIFPLRISFSKYTTTLSTIPRLASHLFG